MAGVDIGRYKRMVRTFFDPEPRNDRVADLPVWCLGVRYESRNSTSIPSESPIIESKNDSCGVTGDIRDPTSSENGDGQARAEKSGQDWPFEFLDDHEAKIWITYRSNFPPIAKSLSASMTLVVRLRSMTEKEGFTSDTGWGCMIRSGQSLLANTIAVLRFGRCWRRHRPSSDGEKQLMSDFADDPAAPFSIHRFVEHGAQACGKHPGEWFGPSATARCIQALTDAHKTANLQVYVNADGANVYQDQVFRVAKHQHGVFSPVLILLGVRLGIDHVTPAYRDALQGCLKLPQSVGIAGGRPSSSHYFIACQGDDFFYLDPHFTRPAIPFHADVTDFTDEELDSYHTRRLRRLNVSDLDPSMLLGFLIRDEGDWAMWRAEIETFQGKSIIHVADSETPLHGQNCERQSAVDEVESFDEDENAE